MLVRSSNNNNAVTSAAATLSAATGVATAAALCRPLSLSAHPTSWTLLQLLQAQPSVTLTGTNAGKVCIHECGNVCIAIQDRA